MKKILSLLTALTLTASSATSVISCSSKDNEDKHVNSNGNSTWAWLPGLNNGKSPDTADVWNEVDPFAKNSAGQFDTNPNDWNTTTKQSVYAQLLQIMNVSILSKLGSSKDQSKYYNPKVNIAGFGTYFKNDFKDAWANLKANVTETINDKKQSYKDNDGKNWEKNYKKFLKDNYDSSEAKYRASLYISGSNDNATSELEKIFLKNNERNNKTVSANYVIGLKTQYNTATDKSKWVNDNPVKARELLLGYTPYINSTTNAVDISWQEDNSDSLTIANIITRLQNNFAKFTIAYKVSEKTYDSKTKKFINTYSSLNDSDNSQAVMSPTQNFINNKYFSTAKPLATSEIVFKFDNSYKLGKDVQNHIPTTTFATDGAFKQDTMKHILDLLGNKDGYNWDELKNNNTIDASEKPTYNKDLLTVMSSDTSTDAESKAAIYGSLTDLMNGTDILNSHAVLDKYVAGDSAPLTKFKNFIKDLNRSQAVGDFSTSEKNKYNKAISNSMYQIYNIGKDNKDINNNVIVMLKDDGLHIIHVDGLNFVKKYTSVAPNSYFKDRTPNAYQSDNNNFNFNINKTIQQNPASWSSTNSINSVNDQNAASTNIFNKNIWNHYLQYLTNYSWINQQSKTSPLEKFNFISSAQTFANAPSSSTLSSGKWYTWILDLFNIYYANINNNPSNWKPIWWQNFMSIGGTDVTAYSRWLSYMDKNDKSSISAQTIIRNFASSIKKQNDTITSKDPSKYPTTGTFNAVESTWATYFAKFMVNDPTKINTTDPNPYSLWYTYQGEQ